MCLKEWLNSLVVRGAKETMVVAPIFSFTAIVCALISSAATVFPTIAGAVFDVGLPFPLS